MAETPGRRLLPLTWKDVLVNVAGAGVISLGGVVVTWLGKGSRLLGGFFPAAWAFLTSPVSAPLGLLLAGVWLVGNLLLFFVLLLARPKMSRLKATSLSASSIVLGVVLLGAGLYLFRDTALPRQPIYRRLTETGDVVQAAVSPDGRFFAYAADHLDGRQSINLGQVDSVEARLTIAGPEEARYGGLTFSPDGLRLYFVKYACNGTVGELHQMAALGGKATKIKENIPRFFSYALSPDGKTFAFVRNNPEEGVSEVVTALATHPGEEKRVAERRKHEQFTGVPAWSPDGTLLTCALRNTETGKTRLVGLNVATEKEEFARDIDWEFVGQVASLPDEGSLILSSTKIYGPSQMWHIPYPGGRPKSVTGEGKNYDGMSPTADSGAVLTVEDKLETYIYAAPAGRPDLAERIDNRAGEHNDFWGFSWTPDGRILYVKNEENGQSIWVMSADGKAHDLLTKGGYNVDPCATPDGRHVVFTRREGGSYDIWRMNADKSGAPKKLTDGGKNFTPHCSADGTVVYTSERHGQWSVMKTNVEGGRPVQLHHRPSQWPAVSPGGSVAFFTVDADGTMLLGVLPAGGGAVKTYPIPCTVSTWAELRWLKPEQELTYVDTRGGVSNLWSLSLASGAVRQLTHFDRDRIFRYDWSADGRLVLSRGTVRRDAVLFNFREPARGGG